jgi:hypothetical protein
MIVLTVVTLLIVNSDGLSPTQYDTVFKAVGLDTLSYTPPSAVTVNTGWPTLGSMIDSGKRLVTFMDEKADFTSVAYIIDGRFHCFRLFFFRSRAYARIHQYVGNCI